MLKRSMYPKTARIPNNGIAYRLTEKLDGENLVFFKWEGKLWIAQRNNAYCYDEVRNGEVTSKQLYQGLYGWLETYGNDLENALCERSAICGEWLARNEGNKIHYGKGAFNFHWYQFAKAYIEFDEAGLPILSRLTYDHELFGYSFENGERPAYLGIVPHVRTLSSNIDKELLDEVYDQYCAEVGRPVEGFVIERLGHVLKYVRYHNGKLVEYDEDSHKRSS